MYSHAPAPYRFREYVHPLPFIDVDRAHPLANARTREDVVLPLSEPVRGRDGTLISQIPLPKNTTVFVGVISSNTNKALWGEDVYEWKPERWLSRLPDALMEAKVPGVYSNLCVTSSAASVLQGSH